MPENKPYGPPKKKKRRGSVNPLGKPRGDVYRDTRRPDSPKKGAKGQADVPTAKQKKAAANIAAVGVAGKTLMVAGKTLMTATKSYRAAKAAKIDKRADASVHKYKSWENFTRAQRWDTQ